LELLCFLVEFDEEPKLSHIADELGDKLLISQLAIEAGGE